MLSSKHPALKEYQAIPSPTQPFSKLTESDQEEKLMELAERVAELMEE